MELIKELGKRTTISKTGKSDSRMWGLFKCPSCGTLVERKVNKGRVSKSCGASGCRVFETNNSWNANMPDEDKLKNLPYYSSFNDYYRRLSANKEYALSWNSFSEFMSDMYEAYAALKNSTSKITLYVTDRNTLTASNSFWVEDVYVKETDFSLDKSNGVLHTLLLEQETGIKHSTIVRALNKMDGTFGEFSYSITSKPGFVSRPTSAYILTEYQYGRLKDRLLDSVKRTSSTDVYLIKGTSYVKIGTTHCVDTRFKSLAGSNELPLELLYSANVVDGTSIEKHLHEKYAEFNKHHEWFELTEEQIKEIIEYLDSVK